MTKGNVNVLVITILRTTGSYGGGPIKNLVLLTEYARVLKTNLHVNFTIVPQEMYARRGSKAVAKRTEMLTRHPRQV